jgi:hypothetical protein
MMHQARGARSLLMRVQPARQKREANQATCDQAAWIEHCATGLMGAALSRFSPALRSSARCVACRRNAISARAGRPAGHRHWHQPDPAALDQVAATG